MNSMKSVSLLCGAVLLAAVSARRDDLAFVAQEPGSRVCVNGLKLASSDNDSSPVLCPRRRLLQQGSLALMGVSSGLLFQQQAAIASGGATAGGVYLLSAKQRYNSRVTKAIQGFLELEASLKGGSIVEASEYFEREDEGTWKDLSAAGYLLANAFRRSSNTPPDSLPAVKKWKAFAKEVESMQRTIRKKDAGGTLVAFEKAEEALDGYLEEVELPTSIEMRK